MNNAIQNKLALGLYQRVLDGNLAELIERNPDLACILKSISEEEAPQTYTQFLSKLLYQALRITKGDKRVPLVNRLIDLLSSSDGLDYLANMKILETPENMLTSVTEEVGVTLERPDTPLNTGALLTGVGGDPHLDHEIRKEMATADRVDILISFIKWSGLRLLIPALELLDRRQVKIRIITTSYMGASDPEALEWLAKQKNIEIKVSYDTSRTRLHAKAYLFERNSGFSTGYIGSANMSHAAMTSGLEWTVKATAQDMPHILQRFAAEFETYWNSEEFEQFDSSQLERFSEAINKARNGGSAHRVHFFADITPRPFQERILESLDAARQDNSFRNLIVAATGTGKTVISAFDYARFARSPNHAGRLLYVAHRKEILQQACDCFRAVLRDANFGELLVDGIVPTAWQHVFASVQSLSRQQPWSSRGNDYFDFVIVDEVHHGPANSYRPLFDQLKPVILLGLTATPERMDGSSVLPDFDNRFAAEIRLPEALDEKLLCPFHYFGVSDPVALDDDIYWKNGKFDESQLTRAYIANDVKAKLRLDAIIGSLWKYQPNLEHVRAVGFCASVEHAKFMATSFKAAGFNATVVLGETPREDRDLRIKDFRAGKIPFIFTVDVFSEGIDVPEINLVMFLRPTESITVFLQQLGRGLRHSPEKECLTVLDFVGQTHKRYRVDRKFAALLSRNRRRIDNEVENDFPNLPVGCSIQLERIAREIVISKIKETLCNLQTFIPEAIQTFVQETKTELTFGSFIEYANISPNILLQKRTWSEWKAMAWGHVQPADPDLTAARSALSRMALRTDTGTLDDLKLLCNSYVAEEPAHYGIAEKRATELHYLIWGKKASDVGVVNHKESFAKWVRNIESAKDAVEIVNWRRHKQPFPTRSIELPYPCSLLLHAAYGSNDIKAALGISSLAKSGPTGIGRLHAKSINTYAHLITFQKDESDFSPTTLYRDYPISRALLHWESQSQTTQQSEVGQNYINFLERGKTILFFARMERNIEGVTAPFIFLGPAKRLISYKGDRPIEMVWELQYLMPAELFEVARTA